jgi:hypothetical protein
MFTNRNLIIAMVVCQAITTLCAVFVAAQVAQVKINEFGSVHANTEIRHQPILVRVAQ